LSPLTGTPAYFIVLGLLCGVVGFRMGWRGRNRWFLPVTQALMGFLAFAASWRTTGPLYAAATVVGWAAGTTLVAIHTFRREGTDVDAIVLRAATYRATMRAWLQSGGGFPPGATLLAHARELALYLLLAAASANLLGLLMGAVLLNSMNAWVATVLGAARQPGTAAIYAWPVWSVVRVLAFILLGAAAAAPLAALAGHPGDPAQLRVLWIAGGAGIVLDLVLKLTLAPACGRKLAAATEFGGDRCAPQA
jgi:hypothetical protein